MAMYYGQLCDCGDRECPGGCYQEMQEERDQNHVTLEQTPEAFGIGPEVDEYALQSLEMELCEVTRSKEFPYSEQSLRLYIHDVTEQLKFPMSAHLRDALYVELAKWVNHLRAAEAVGRAPEFRKAVSESITTIEKADHAR